MSKRGSTHSESARARMRAAWTRRRLFKPVTEETRDKQRVAAMGNTRRVGSRHTAETRAKLRAAWARRKARNADESTTPV